MTFPSGRCPHTGSKTKGATVSGTHPCRPRRVGVRLHYRSIVERENGELARSAYQDTIVRPNLPDRTESVDSLLTGAEGLVGNRLMTIRVDGRGSTYDIYFPTVGLHSYVRPREGDLPQSRCHFRGIIGGLAVGRRLDWFTERAAWEAYQQYQGATNLLTTKLTSKHGPIQVRITDFAAFGDCLPLNAGREKSAGQYIKRFLIKNEGTETRHAVFAVYVQAEVNGGVGDVGLSWHDIDNSLLAINRGHVHANRKLARDATIEFALALDGKGDVECEPTGPNEAILFRSIELPAAGSVTVDMLVSGAFTGWSGDQGDVRALAAAGAQLVSLERPGRGRAHHGQGMGRFHRADSRSLFPQADLRRASEAIGAGGGAARRHGVGRASHRASIAA